ncbi:ABC-2 type transport system permease protein [Streptomyces sp. WMMB 714]|uniref:ABC transporter permease subunit n=1 Tax=Streptomyces sp. WMMB 714 TaxID=1286822 RepID=UPI000823B3DE|nr:ABC transporter permease subunit [Streptomyces sp. WMMB 714]SCK21876.1 ABC-2 type transport system permease protein [Streptomyces sp. WMMB 714]
MSPEPQAPRSAPESGTAPAPSALTKQAPGAGARGENVIHNIGYRNYDGPRLGRSYARASLFEQSLRGAYGLGRSAKSKVLPMILFAVMCVPAAIVVAVTVFTKAKEMPIEYSSYVIQMQPVIGIYIAAMAPQAVSLDLRFRVVPLYFSRPIRRGDYVAAKYAALSAAIFVFTATSVVILYVGALLAKLDFGDQTKDFALGLVCCLVFSVLHAGIGLAAAAATPRRGFGVAAIIAVLTIPYMLISALQAIVSSQDETSAVGWLGLGSPGSLIDGLQSKLLGGRNAFPMGVELTNAQASVYVALVALLIACTYALLLRRYRKAGL